MKHFDYRFTEAWTGYFPVLAESRAEADEIVRDMDLTSLKTGLTDRLSFDIGDVTPSSEWDEENEVFYDDETIKPVKYVARSLLFDLVPPPKTKRNEPEFTKDELTMISDALLRAISDASRAASLVDSAEAKETISAHIEKLQALNRKVVYTK